MKTYLLSLFFLFCLFGFFSAGIPDNNSLLNNVTLAAYTNLVRIQVQMSELKQQSGMKVST